MSIFENLNGNTGGGSVLFPIEEAADHPGCAEERGKRLFLVGGPWGPLYPMGYFPADLYGEEEDPNP